MVVETAGGANPSSLFFLSTGFNVEKVQYKNVLFTVWDVGGQEKVRERTETKKGWTTSP